MLCVLAADDPIQAYACEGSTLSLECRPGHVISIQRANYGRLKLDVCNHDSAATANWNLQCISTRSLSIVLQL